MNLASTQLAEIRHPFEQAHHRVTPTRSDHVRRLSLRELLGLWRLVALAGIAAVTGVIGFALYGAPDTDGARTEAARRLSERSMESGGSVAITVGIVAAVAIAGLVVARNRKGDDL